jgi:hypothetical protein
MEKEKTIDLNDEQIKDRQFQLDNYLVSLESLESQVSQLKKTLELNLTERSTEFEIRELKKEREWLKTAVMPEEDKKLKIAENEVKRVQFEKMKELDVSTLQMQNQLRMTEKELERVKHNIKALKIQIRTKKQPI